MTDPDNIGAADELAELREQMRELKHRETEIRAALLSDPDARVGKRHLVTIRTVHSRRIDADKLRRDYPQIAEAVTVETETQQLMISALTADVEVITLRPRAAEGARRTRH